MGSITQEEFVECCFSFVKASQILRDGWQLREHEQGRYITKKFVKSLQLSENNPNFNIENGQVLIECHVIYSTSYANPVLYFSACKLNGKLLKLDECWNMVDASYHLCTQNKWTFLTQAEHPLLLLPYFQIHPCHTQDFMKCLDTSKKAHNYIFAWLSIVLPVLNLHLPIDEYYDYFLKTSKVND